MTGSLKTQADLISFYLKRGEIEKSRAIAEEVIRNHPDDFHGYLLMVQHYSLLNQKDDVLHWLDEALQRNPEAEIVLEMALTMYQVFLVDDQKRKDLIETGLQLYPHNHFFHAQHAEINKQENSEQAIASYQEAIRLDPHNDEYLGNYAVYLYQLGNMEEAKKYEQSSLQANPENIQMLLHFAWIAYQLRQYKKAQMLIDDAMRIDPTNKVVREYYQKIYPTKNAFIRAKTGLNHFLIQLWKLPTRWIYRLTKEKVHPVLIMLCVIQLELAGFYLLAGKQLFFIIGGVYLCIFFISSMISRAMLRQIGFTDTEEVSMAKQASMLQQSALTEMKEEIYQNNQSQSTAHERLSSDELAKQLAKIWGSTEIASIQQETVSGTDRIVTDKTTIQEPGHDPNDRQSVGQKWPKEYHRWPFYVMLASVILSILIRQGLMLSSPTQQVDSIPDEVRTTIQAGQHQLENQDHPNLDENREVVEEFLTLFREDDAKHRLKEFVLDSYLPVLIENQDHPFFKQVATAKISAVLQPTRATPTFYFLISNEIEEATAIVQTSFGMITKIYADQWHLAEDDETTYQELRELIQQNGDWLD